MNITLLKCKLHRAVVTDTHLDYEGSCAIDESLLEAADLRPYEQIHLWNVTNGERLVTYVIRAPRDSGIISVNGSAARKAQVGDILIIAAFAEMTPVEADSFIPQLVYLDHHNRIARLGHEIPVMPQAIAV
jgi:aspartate 1-decarboxylase